MKKKNHLGFVVERGMQEYAMYVLEDRTIPDFRDGLKPVQRRLLTTLFEGSMGSTPSGKYIKCAAPVGTTVARYHPHGDTACYGALVNMSGILDLKTDQYYSHNFAVPLVEGYGNFGAVDDVKPSFAAMRYTECRVTRFATELNRLRHCIDTYPNYLNNRQQPIVFPSTLPFLLLNGASGIAVGTACNIPSFNIHEVLKVASMFLKGTPSIKKIVKAMPGPDWHYGGTILDEDQVMEVYKTGRGSISMGLNTTVKKKGKKFLVTITGIPPRFNIGKYKEKLLEEKEVKSLHDFGDTEKGIHIEVLTTTEKMMKKIVNKKFNIPNQWNVIARRDEDNVDFFSTNVVDFFKRWVRWCIYQHKRFFVAEINVLKSEIRKDLLRLRCFKHIKKVVQLIRQEKYKALKKLLNINDEELQFVLSIRLGALAKTNIQTIHDRIKARMETIRTLKGYFYDTEGYLRKHWKNIAKTAKKRSSVANF